MAFETPFEGLPPMSDHLTMRLDGREHFLIFRYVVYYF
jgi:hypothetical protein